MSCHFSVRALALVSALAVASTQFATAAIQPAAAAADGLAAVHYTDTHARDDEQDHDKAQQ